ESFISSVAHSGIIIIADMGPNAESYRPVLEALRKSRESGIKNYWIDHHIWPDGAEDELGKVCELVLSRESNGSKKCTAELFAETFTPKNPLALQLSRMAHRTDFADNRFPIPPLTALISYYVGFPDLKGRLESVIIQSVTKGVLWNTQMQDDVIDASRLIDE